MNAPKIIPSEELAYLVHGSVMMELSHIGEKVMLEFLPTVDALMQVVAQMAVETGFLQSAKDERVFGDRMRDALKGHIRDAKNRPPEQRWAYPVQTSGAAN
jgi:hypothetical protein